MVALTTLKDYQDLTQTIDLAMRWNGVDCTGGKGWCGMGDLSLQAPQGSVAAKLFLWPAYLGMRLSYGFWLLGPRLFGYRLRFVVEGGVAGTRLVKVRGKLQAEAAAAVATPVAADVPAAKAKAARPAAKKAR